jgi:hypothetical protein
MGEPPTIMPIFAMRTPPLTPPPLPNDPMPSVGLARSNRDFLQMGMSFVIGLMHSIALSRIIALSNTAENGEEETGEKVTSLPSNPGSLTVGVVEGMDASILIDFANNGTFEDIDVSIIAGLVDNAKVEDMDKSIIVGVIEGNCVGLFSCEIICSPSCVSLCASSKYETILSKLPRCSMLDTGVPQLASWHP